MVIWGVPKVFIHRLNEHFLAKYLPKFFMLSLYYVDLGFFFFGQPLRTLLTKDGRMEIVLVAGNLGKLSLGRD